MWLQDVFSQSVFLTIGIISLAVLVVAFLLDGLFEFFDFGDGPLSLTTLGAFGSLFGFIGYASTGFGASAPIAALIGAVAGLLGAVGAWGLSLFFKKTSSTASVSIATLVGAKGTVTLRIPGGENPGEIAYIHNGIRHNYIAYSTEAIPSGTPVKITAIRGGNAVNVEPVSSETTTETE
jgi:hypothetical protein